MFHVELHLYEGFISSQEGQKFWQTGLSMVGLWKSKSVEISDAWQASARTLLDRIFQKWSPSDKESTESLCNNLKCFIWSFYSAHERAAYPDKSIPPMVMVGATKILPILIRL